jgi:hypothetical protein
MKVSVESKFKFQIENTAAAQQKSITICEKLREESMKIYLDFESMIEIELNIYSEYLIV